ncbi:MAG: hypothetical protein AB7O04_07620 [Hyphomonadaceae bacterium]
MNGLVLQLQLLLAALSAFLPLVPEKSRDRASEILDMAAKALAAGASVTGNLDDLAKKLAAVRAEVEAIASAGRAVTPDELDAALQHVKAASAAFRAALSSAEARA